MGKAHSNHTMLPCRWFYRNKPFEYFQDIERNHHNVMKVYIKDNNGDPASPINGTIKGLFFGVNVEKATGEPIPKSHFGPQRFLIPSSVMFMTFPNLYFTDFYCNNTAHYVTLVMTVNGSEVDRFCQEKLLRLNMESNPFLMFRSQSGEAFVSQDVWVEVLCTESIDLVYAQIRNGAYFTTVESQGTSRPGGIPKNPRCKTCNLYMT